ncbi:hypothetical protein [Frankia tisae]|uniref:hypothetical protein n=1 Tax=Frankia tisae TaxID=2950104 RepID=UPI0021BE79EB|nr:hypothetical protein [Frankia tisae]
MNRNPAIHRHPSGDIDIAVVEVTIAPEPGPVAAQAPAGQPPALTIAHDSPPPPSVEPGT